MRPRCFHSWGSRWPTEKKPKDMCANQIKEKTGFDDLEDLIDEAMAVAGEKVYNVRDQLVSLRS